MVHFDAAFVLLFGDSTSVGWRCDESVRMIDNHSSCTFGRTRFEKVGHPDIFVARTFFEEKFSVFLCHVLNR